MNLTRHVFDDLDALSRAAAQHIAGRIEATVPTFHLVLSGGSTPKRLYEVLGTDYRETVPWERVHFWFGDERFVPVDDPSSNEGMARVALLDRLPIEPAQIHGMFSHKTAEEAAADYADEIELCLEGSPFDLILLGLGPDAHTASLFPGDASLHETVKTVVASQGAAGVKQRLTLAPPVLQEAKEVLFLVAGADKAEPLSHVLHGPYDPDKYPAQIVARKSRHVIWFLDRLANAGVGM